MTTNRMGLTPDQSANCFSDDELEMMQHENNPHSHAFRELLAYRKASMGPVADAVAWNKPGEERKCDIRWRRFDVAPGPLCAAPPLQLVPTAGNSFRLSQQRIWSLKGLNLNLTHSLVIRMNGRHTKL